MFDYLTKQIESLNAEIESAKKHIEALEDFKSVVMRQRQKVCEHKNTYKLDNMDYHNNVDWVETRCNDCGKYLGKE